MILSILGVPQEEDLDFIDNGEARNFIQR